MMNHHEMLERGFLSNGLDPESRSNWPTDAQVHFDTCSRCKHLLQAEEQLVQAGALLSRQEADWSPRPDPRLLRQRARRRRAPAFTALSQSLPAFETGPWRSAPLELFRTPEGIRAWHPEACRIAVFAALGNREPVLIGDASAERPGVGVEVPLDLDEEGQVYAIAMRQGLDPFFWELWLSDQYRESAGESFVLEDPDNRVHFARIQILPEIQPHRILTQKTPLGEPTAEITLQLREAAKAGRSENISEASRLYRSALERSSQIGDSAGRVKASCGLALGLQAQGFHHDSELIIRFLLDRCAFDTWWGAWICRYMARTALGYGDSLRAQAWMKRCRDIEGPDSTLLAHLELELAAYSSSATLAAAIVDAANDSTSPVQHAAEMDRVRLLCLLNRTQEAKKLFDRLADAIPCNLEWALRKTLARVALDQAQGTASSWEELLAKLHPFLQKLDGKSLSIWDSLLLIQLVERALDSGELTIAIRLFRLRFLDTVSAADPEIRLLGLTWTNNGILVLDPEPGLRRLRLRRTDMLRLATAAREQVMTSRDSDASTVLSSILFPNGALPKGEILVASDGVLSNAPIFSIAYNLDGMNREPPVLREITSHRSLSSPVIPTRSKAVVSLADSLGNLPYASMELRKEEASLWLRGQDLSLEALRAIPPVGLLHLAVHTRRDHGIPELVLADGPVSAAEILEIKLKGHPIILLASCKSGESSSHMGIERSFAQAFLQAGASAVIATRWPVVDSEMYRFVRAVVEAWPFQDPSTVVAHICRQLRERGEPARLWAAPVVY